MSRTVILNYNDETARELAQALNIDEQRIRDESDEPAPSNVDIVGTSSEDYQPTSMPAPRPTSRNRPTRSRFWALFAQELQSVPLINGFDHCCRRWSVARLS